MFKNREIHVQMVKTPKSTEAPEKESAFKIPTHQQIKDATLLIGAAYTTKVVLDTSREIALLIAKAKIG